MSQSLSKSRLLGVLHADNETIAHTDYTRSGRMVATYALNATDCFMVSRPKMSRDADSVAVAGNEPLRLNPAVSRLIAYARR